MRDALARYDGGVYELVAYHLGWRDEHGRPADSGAGKMLRPALCLAAASGYGDAADAADAAVALELLHAFSLVHDDIEDGDRERRHRPALWALRGVPLAINAGDCLFALAHRVLHDAIAPLPPARALPALRIFDDACLSMIEGQHLDIEFESRPAVSREAYVRMSAGKTGALIGASLALGGLCGGAPEDGVQALREAGIEAGLAFQAVDDALAVWGEPATTGKPAGNDAARGKKSLPAVVAAERALPLDDPAVRADVMRIAGEHAERARALLQTAALAPGARAAIDDLISFMLRREW
jgi:geranylgeranyl diphosphate synthase type I